MVFALVVGGNAQRSSLVTALDGVNDPAHPAANTSIGTCPDGWDTSFTTNGADNQVNAIVPDGTGDYYIGGEFGSVQGVAASGVAKWDAQTQTWKALGSGVNGEVYAIAINGNDIYVGGAFSMAGGSPARNVAKWNGTSWSPLASGLGQGTHIVRAIAIHNGEVFIGGNFTVSDGSPANGIVRWDGTSFSSVGNFLGQVRSLASAGGFLYASGNVAHVAGNSYGVIRWDGTEWASFGTSPQSSSTVNAIAVNGNDLYFVGNQIVIPGQQSAQVARFDGTNWTRMAFFSNGIVNAVAVVNGEVHVGGYLPDPPNLFNNLVKWNGSNWVSLGAGIQGGSSSSERVMALSNIDGTLFVGGNFTTAGGLGAKNIAKNTSGTWSAFPGTGIDSPARAIAVSGSDVYVGGSFTTAGPLTVNRIAKWNGTAWSALGSGVIGDVNAIAVAGNKVYVGGNFATIGGVSASRIAAWDGQNWSALGSGVNGPVHSIVVRGEDIFVGGDFQTAGGTATNRIAKWNGTSWTVYPTAPIPNTVTGLGFIGNDLYVSSDTTTVDNPNYLLKYDGANWTGLAVGMGGHGVRSMAISGTDLYVAGGFQAVGGISAARVARWNGSQWSALGSGIPGSSNSIRLTVAGDDLIATGDFTNAGGTPASRIARWNGTDWTALGAGLSDQGLTVVAAGGDIFAGGNFSVAGCNTSPYFARYRDVVWTASTSTDWHTPSNWGNGSVPEANSGISITSSDVSISSADVSVSSLVVANGRTVTIGAGRTLTVNGDLDLSSGSITGAGDLIVNGGLRVGGDINISGSVTVNGDLYLIGGILSPSDGVDVTACRASAISGGGITSFVSSRLSRCIGSGAAFRFPVGSDGIYSPVVVSSVSGSGEFAVMAKTGSYPNVATGLPTNRLQRWWDLDARGISQANLLLNYNDNEVIGIEGRYRAYAIDGGNATLFSTLLNRNANTALITGLTSFSDVTLAEGQPNFETLKGRIRTPSNRGADRVLVSLTDSSGNVRFAMSNNSGYYRFLGVETWKNYTVRVLSKKYTFLPPERTLEFVDSAPDIDFLSTDH